MLHLCRGSYVQLGQTEQLLLLGGVSKSLLRDQGDEIEIGGIRISRSTFYPLLYSDGT